MFNTKQSQWLNQKFSQDTHILTWIEAFLVDRKAQNMAKGTIYYYTKKLKLFTDFCESQAVTQITQIDSYLIRQYMLYLETSGHNSGGCHQGYRTLKTFLLWWEQEVEPEDWKNPIRKVKAPKLPVEPLEPVSVDVVKSMLETCQGSTLIGLRDKAILLFLLDTGVRASEFCSIYLDDYNLITGEVLIRQGKGRKPRNAYLGDKTRITVRKYLKHRTDKNLALWVTDEGEKLSYWGLKSIMRRRASLAKVECPEVHAFRRFFALACLRAGMDIYSLQNLMGHADLQVLRRYLKQSNQDIREAHRKASPVDNLE